MPVVAVVKGVKIVFYANEHPLAHFHALIAEHRAVIDIMEAKIAAGTLPRAKRAAVLSWTVDRRAALLERFTPALAHERVEPIT
jgi:predicted LPLAT superfamily acyltransferase